MQIVKESESSLSALITSSVFVRHQTVHLSSGDQTVVIYASATHTDTVILPLASVPATPTAGAHSVSTPANVPATVTATLSTETAPAMKAGGCQPAPSSASAPLRGL